MKAGLAQVASFAFLVTVLASAAAIAAPCSHGVYLNTKNWMGSDRTDADLETLAKQIDAASMDRVYIRANTFKDPGDKPRLTRLIAVLKKQRPGLKIFGYYGAGIKNGVYPDPTAQVKKIASLGFDGVQIDYETTPPGGNPKYLQVLALARAAAPSLKLSVAGYFLLPDKTLVAHAQPKGIEGHTLIQWDAKFYSKVLDQVDDVMVMNYDTTLKSPEAYAEFTAWQHDRLRELAQKSAKTPPPQVSIGLPTRVPGRQKSSDRKAEDFAVGMRGLGARMAPGQCNSSIVGATLFDDSGLKDADWAEFARLAKVEAPTTSEPGSTETGAPAAR